MEFQFKKQQYQTDAVTNTVEVFAGQPYQDGNSYLMGHKTTGHQMLMDEYGRRNAPLNIGPNVKERLLLNIQEIQKRSNILMSDKLVGDPKLGSCVLDIEMETGTGKTYVYIKTIFELNKRYGWEKFIVVVPSIAIREGVVKSFSMLERHFFNEYEKKAEYFVYDSSNLSMLRQFATSDNIEVMIINIQAFNSFDESKKNNVTRTIYSQRDEFNSLRPIDVIARTNPIMLIDEPQKAEGKKTIDGLAQFNPLFTINYSATHRTKHNCIYALDAVDAFEQKLVKRISVKGFELKNLSGSDGY
ncbi:MAG: DEAD/DEAH box helicase family protein, partial [Anaerobiospirillum succiniciproducens]|uniref:DEAD/DEAH box helicase family protein n=1 Tax=Anaerobiospirillum succiniciproducens TaxID=13335 RepID=UPI002A760899